MKGIDISQGSGGVDFHQLKKDGYEFAIIRAGYGSDISQKDRRFDEYVRGALDAGLHVGAYWFIYARTFDEARKNGACFAEVLEPFKGKLDMPVFIDYEYDSTRYYEQTTGAKETKEIATQMVHIAADYMEIRGYYTGVYLNPDYILHHVNLDPLMRYTLWLAEWKNPATPPSYECAIWQFNGDTKTQYASGGIDLNLCYQTDLPAVIRSGGFNGFEKKQNSDPVTVQPADFFGRSVRILSNGTWEYV